MKIVAFVFSCVLMYEYLGGFNTGQWIFLIVVVVIDFLCMVAKEIK